MLTFLLLLATVFAAQDTPTTAIISTVSVAAVIIVPIITAFIVYKCKKYRKKSSEPEPEPEPEPELEMTHLGALNDKTEFPY